ncbi:MAG: hypothetical protein K0R14_513 [Burkholderiales bacterium]|nr:hypothetical protein [Burkholderiales bacterium]
MKIKNKFNCLVFSLFLLFFCTGLAWGEDIYWRGLPPKDQSGQFTISLRGKLRDVKDEFKTFMGSGVAEEISICWKVLADKNGQGPSIEINFPTEISIRTVVVNDKGEVTKILNLKKSPDHRYEVFNFQIDHQTNKITFEFTVSSNGETIFSIKDSADLQMPLTNKATTTITRSCCEKYYR